MRERSSLKEFHISPTWLLKKIPTVTVLLLTKLTVATSALHLHQVMVDEGREISSDCNEMVLVDQESPTLRSCSYYNVEYVNTCIVEVHEDNN